MASGWNLWEWLQCIGVVSGCCCKEVYTCRYHHNNYALFWAAASLYTSLFILKMFFVLYNYRARGKHCKETILNVEH